MNQVFWYERAAAARDCPCLFLDRDGVIVEEVNYLHRREDVRVLDGAAALIARAKARGYAVGMVTNQAGVARGYYDWQAFEIVLVAIYEQLGLGSDPFDFVAACGSHGEGSVPALRIDGHSWRKPSPGMILSAQASLRLDLGASVMVGDQLSDIQAAEAAGVGRAFHVTTGHGRVQRASVERYVPRPACRMHLVDTLHDVVPALGG